MKTQNITDPQEIADIIGRCPYCILSLIDEEGNPYAIPMNFAYHEGVVYLHSGSEGTKMEAVRHNPNVCLTFCEGHELVYIHQQVACSYSMKSRSVVCRGKVHFIEELEEKRRILQIFMRHYTDNECGFSAPAVRNVVIWAIPVTQMTCKSFGLRAAELR